MDILFLPGCVRQFKKLPKPIQEVALDKISIFKADPFHPSLKTHKLKGELDGLWSFWINFKYRALFKFSDSGVAKVYQIGDHGIYD
jgi:plasmid maintenance system killer protein